MKSIFAVCTLFSAIAAINLSSKATVDTSTESELSPAPTLVPLEIRPDGDYGMIYSVYCQRAVEYLDEKDVATMDDDVVVV